MCKFRTLKASEIEVRVQSVKNGKATHLLYIDSRAVTNLLDETVGSMNWQSEFYEVAGQTICRIGIWDNEKGCFIYKSDTGSESNIEGEKGKISDCYKRCLSRWGVTELYSAPRIQLDDDGYGNSGYSVSEINIDDSRQITHIVLVNRFDKEVFRWDKTARKQSQTTKQATVPQPTPQPPQPPKKVITERTLSVPEQVQNMLSMLQEGAAVAHANGLDFSPIIFLREKGFEVEDGVGTKITNLFYNNQ